MNSVDRARPGRTGTRSPADAMFSHDIPGRLWRDLRREEASRL
ncbi:hypothetical protein ABT294_29940 [Nonomuraea sp. NPDC000554]